MRETEYYINKVNIAEVYEALQDISFGEGEIYLLPKARTRVIVHQNSEKITLNIRTNRRSKVEKSLRRLLNSFNAKWSREGAGGMRRQDHLIHM